MTIAIIGTGNMGRALAERLAEAGEEVVLASRDAGRARSIASEIGPKVRGCGLEEVGGEADLLVLAVHYAKAADVLAKIGDLSGKVIVDMSNPVTEDFMALTIGHTTSAAEEIQKLAPKAHVVKAFNTIFAQLLAQPPKGQLGRVQVFYAADDAAAAEQTAHLIASIGFQPVNAGPLQNARYLEPVGELNIHLGFALGWGTATAPAWVQFAA